MHSWNGKYRRPAELWTPQYNVPMRDALLWVYEGMTQYWGHVLAARSGLSTAEQARDRLAHVAAYLDVRAGRTWRNLQDTTNEGIIGRRRDKAWPDWQRGADYYDEAILLWLDVDTLIRQKSGDRRSLDDFARAFFGGATSTHADGSVRPMTYTFAELVQALNAVQAHDWAAFLRERLDSHGPGAPLDGLQRGGWKLGFTEEQSKFARQAPGRGGASGRERSADFRFSLGLNLGTDGRLEQVLWGSPAFDARLAPGMQIVAVAGEAYKGERLAEAVRANREGKQPIELIVKDGERYMVMRLDYRGGLRYPRLERLDSQPDRLNKIYESRKP